MESVSARQIRNTKGAGRIGTVHARSITYHIPQAQVVCVSDVAKDRAKALAAELGIPDFTGDYREILADPDVDAVLVCSPTNTTSDTATRSGE